MAKKQAEEKWMEGRDRPVRVYLTEEEHALVRLAAARVDKSVSRFSVESIVSMARTVMGMKTESASAPASQEEEPAVSAPRPRGKPAAAAGPADQGEAEPKEPAAEKPKGKGKRQK